MTYYDLETEEEKAKRWNSRFNPKKFYLTDILEISKRRREEMYDNQRMLTKIIHGSRLYGTNTPSSDQDFKSVYLPSAKEILLGNAQRVKDTGTKSDFTQKNTATDIDDSSYAVSKFIKLLTDGDTSAVEILLAPPEFRLETSDEFEEIYSHRMRLLNRQSKGFVGYAKSQSAKYSIKGSRLTALQDIVTLFESLDSKARLSDHEEELKKFVNTHEHSYFEPKTMPNGSVINHLTVCGKMAPFTNKVSSVIEAFRNEANAYGNRAKLAQSNSNVDRKAVSHAVRVGTQAIELMTTGNLVFPRPDAKYLLDIKLGNADYAKVGEYMNELLDKVEEASKNSVLPEHSDAKLAEDLVIKFHRSQII